MPGRVSGYFVRMLARWLGNHIKEICSINRSKFGSIIGFLSLRDPVRVIFPYWVEAISIIVDEIATQKRANKPVFARNDSCLTYDAIVLARRLVKSNSLYNKDKGEYVRYR
jgi:hypothetical protein